MEGPFFFLLMVVQLAHSPSVRLRGQLPRGGSLSYYTAQPHRSRLSRWRLSRGTARSRTEWRKCHRAAARPREAHEGSTTPGKDEIEGAGEGRGGRRPWAELGCPLWPSLLLSRERERRCSTNAHSQTERRVARKIIPPAAADWHSRLRILPQSAFADSSLPEGALVTALRREMPPSRHQIQHIHILPHIRKRIRHLAHNN